MFVEDQNENAEVRISAIKFVGSVALSNRWNEELVKIIRDYFKESIAVETKKQKMHFEDGIGSEIIEEMVTQLNEIKKVLRSR